MCKQNPAIRHLRHLCEPYVHPTTIYLFLPPSLSLSLSFHEIARMIREKRRKPRSINRAKADRVRHVENDVSRDCGLHERKSRRNKRERERERERDGDLAAEDSRRVAGEFRSFSQSGFRSGPRVVCRSGQPQVVHGLGPVAAPSVRTYASSTWCRRGKPVTRIKPTD